MILDEITLSGWRCYRDAHTFRIRDGFNLLVGDNGAGKSTLFEALTRAFFDKYTGASELIKQIQPIDSTLAPDVTVTFRSGGERYRIRKRFLNKPVCTLHKYVANDWRLDAEGDSAEIRVRGVLSGAQSARAAGPDHRGLAQALWYLQYDPALPDDKNSWSDGVTSSLATVLEQVTTTDQERMLLAHLKEAFERNFTANGKEKAGGALLTARAELVMLGKQIERLRIELAKADTLRADLERLDIDRAGAVHAVELAARQVAAVRDKVEAGAEVEARKQKLETDIELAERTLEPLRRDLGMIEQRLTKIASLNETVEMARRESRKCIETAADSNTSRERLAKERADQHSPKLRALVEELGLLAALERLNKLYKDRDRLKEESKQIGEATAEARARRSEAKSIRAPDAAWMRGYDETDRDLVVNLARKASSAIRIEFDLDDRTSTIAASPQTEEEADGDNEDGTAKRYLITRETSFQIPNVGTVRVGGGGESIEKLDRTISELEGKIRRQHRDFDVCCREELAALVEQRIQAESIAARAEQRLKDLESFHKTGSKIDVRTWIDEELARIEIGIAEESNAAASAPPEWREWGGERLRSEGTKREKERKTLDDRIAASIVDEERLRAEHLRLSTEGADHVNRAVTAEAGANQMIAENRNAILQFGSVSELKRSIADDEKRLFALSVSLEEVNTVFDEVVIRPRKAFDVAERSLTAADEALHLAEQEIVRKTGMMEGLIAGDPFTALDDCEARLVAATARLREIEERAFAIRLLRDRAVAAEANRRKGVTAPVARIVTKWMKQVSHGSLESVDIDESLRPAAAVVAGFNETLPRNSLSFGTQEQLVTLLRLAMGQLLSDKEPQLVVIDDRLVNADPQRMLELKMILTEVATTCQVVVATCDGHRYAGIPGTTIRVPADGLRERL